MGSKTLDKLFTVLVVDVSTPSRVAISTPSKVLLVVMAPVIAPPERGIILAQDVTPEPLDVSD